MRATVKESIIGPNCEVGAYSRLTRCLLMEGAVVGEGVTLTGCIVGRRARVEGLKPKPAEGSQAESGGSGAGGAGVGGVGGGVEGEKKKAKGKGKAVEDEEEERTKLTECEVAPKFVIEAGTEAKGEKFMAFDDAEGFGEGGGDKDEGGDERLVL